MRAAATQPSLELAGFEDRRRTTAGRFATDSALRRDENVATLINFLRRMGVRILRVDKGRMVAATSRGPTRLNSVPCYTQVFLDGVPIMESAGFDLRNLHLNQIEAIEYYASASQTPLMFERGTASCGVLVFWLR